MKRRTFIQHTAALGAGIAASKLSWASPLQGFPVVRFTKDKRHFSSHAVEKAIDIFQKKVADKELGWLFNNCFPNTLDTTVYPENKSGKPDTYIITGDIDAMWLRDSSAQVWPYLQFVHEDAKLKELIAGVINRQSKNVILDPFANAFYNDPKKVGEWGTDHTDMKAGIHERKWEIDSLCYTIRLAYRYWKETGDTAPFDDNWLLAQKTIIKTFKDQQRKAGKGSYHFQRSTPNATDTLTMSGYGYPVNPVGLICSAFRPSDDATVFSFLIPSNLFAVVSLRHSAEMLREILKATDTASEASALADEVEQAVNKYGIIEHPTHGRVYAFEVDGFGSYLMMDDANVPSLLSLPYLGAVEVNDPVYQKTRAYILSEHNPFYFKGTAAEGIGGPHVGQDMIWPMAITMRGLTSIEDEEIAACIKTLRNTHGDTGFMHETFHKDDPKKFTRSWFAWANTLFGEFLWKTFQEKPHLLS
ncbi:hypothetical protein SAMN05216436_12734 [bacterium A37T11]|nr:hypothetical protein SAMN05216436_12734 [bacterium A37T11]